MQKVSKEYLLLFNAITDALMQMEKQNYGSAKETLISAQQRAEELYLSAEDESGRPRCLASEKATTLAVVFFYGNFAMLLFESCDAALDPRIRRYIQASPAIPDRCARCNDFLNPFANLRDEVLTKV